MNSRSAASTIRSGDQPSPKECLALIERLARTEQFVKASRLRSLLLYIGEESAKNDGGEIKEHDIGVRVFGRADSYDPGQDNIVRVNASELRKRLEAYFANEGAQEPLIVEVPRGAYKAVFRKRFFAEVEPPQVIRTQKVQEAAPIPSSLRESKSYLVRLWVAVPVTVLLAACFAFWQQNRTLRKSLHPLNDSPAVSALWSHFIDSGRVTDLVPADQGFLVVEQLRKQQISLEAYQNRSFITAPPGEPGLSDIPHIEHYIFSKHLVSMSDAVLVNRILALDAHSNNMVLYNARHYSIDLMKRDNVIVIGGPIANPWDQLFEGHLNFVENADLSTPGSAEFVNRGPRGNERARYPEDQSSGYGMVAFLPNPGGGGNVLLIQGTDPEAAESAASFLLTEDRMRDLLKIINLRTFPYFELLLKVSRIHGSSPISSSVEAYRTYEAAR